MCILFPQSMMCSWVNVFYEEICSRSLADFTVNILAVSYYLVVGLNFYPSLHRPMSVDYKRFCEEAAAIGMMAFFIKECVVEIPGTSSCPRRKVQLSVPSDPPQLQKPASPELRPFRCAQFLPYQFPSADRVLLISEIGYSL